MARGQSDAIRTTARQLMATVVRREQHPKSQELIPLFREVEPGETRVSGSLTAIECRTGGVSLVVRTAERDLRITTPGFDAIEFLTYRSDLTGEVACGPRAPADPVLVTWRGAMPLSGDVQTARVVVEFTPIP